MSVESSPVSWRRPRSRGLSRSRTRKIESPSPKTSSSVRLSPSFLHIRPGSRRSRIRLPGGLTLRLQLHSKSTVTGSEGNSLFVLGNYSDLTNQTSQNDQFLILGEKRKEHRWENLRSRAGSLLEKSASTRGRSTAKRRGLLSKTCWLIATGEASLFPANMPRHLPGISRNSTR